MGFKPAASLGVLKNRAFSLFLSSQGVSYLGDAFHVIAAAALLVNVTGSGLAAGFSLVCTPLCSLFLSPFAGNLGDAFREKHLLVILDLLRGAVAFLFIGNHSVGAIYALLLALSALDILYAPARKKIITGILDSREIMTGNSMLSGAFGGAYILGPVAAGVIVGVWGCNIAFFINGLSFVFSALLILFIRTEERVVKRSRGSGAGAFKGILEGLKYFKSVNSIKKLVIINTVVCFGTASVNIAFYPFAFDMLRVTSKGWGVMLSIFYGTNLLAMLVSLFLDEKISRAALPCIYLAFFITAAVWFCYGIAESLPAVLILQFIEGAASSLGGIILATQLQLATRKAFTGRVMGMNDFLNNGGKLLGIGGTYLLLHFLGLRAQFIIQSIILSAFTLWGLFTLQAAGRKSKIKAAA